VKETQRLMRLDTAGTPPREMARILKKRPSQISTKLSQVRHHTRPPGEITTYVDEQGRTITKCPPGYARGAYPSHTVGCAKRS
jgi:hypothetical protein